MLGTRSPLVWLTALHFFNANIIIPKVKSGHISPYSWMIRTNQFDIRVHSNFNIQGHQIFFLGLFNDILSN
jgi:hypothetical protein